MRTNILSHLTGRTTFNTPGWEGVPIAAVPLLDEVRSYLFGQWSEWSGGDWMIAGVLALLEQDRRVTETVRSATGYDGFDGSLWRRPEDAWSGGTILPDHTGPPVVLHEPAVWPAGDNWMFRLDGSVLHVSTTHVSLALRCAGNNDALQVAWPEDLGFRGKLSCPSGTALLRHVPLLPVNIIADGLGSLPTVFPLLDAVGLLGAWNSAINPAERVASVAAAVVAASAGGLP